MKKNRYILFVLLMLIYSCINVESPENENSRNIHMHKDTLSIVNKDTLPKKSFLDIKLESFLESINKKELSINDFYEYSRFDDGAKIVPERIATKLLNVDTFKATSGKILVLFMSEREGVLLGTFQYNDSLLSRTIYTIHDTESLRCIDKLMFTKEIVSGEKLYSILNSGFIGDTLKVNYHLPFDIDTRRMNTEHNNPNFEINEKYIISDKGFYRVKN